MSGDRSFSTHMSHTLWLCVIRRDNEIVPFEELVSSYTLLAEVGHTLCRLGWPARTPEEIRQELLRLKSRWMKQVHYSDA